MLRPTWHEAGLLNWNTLSNGRMETHKYLGISLIRVIKELAGRVRLLEELVRAEPDLGAKYAEQLRLQAAYEEDEYQRLVAVLSEVLERLPELIHQMLNKHPGLYSGWFCILSGQSFVPAAVMKSLLRTPVEKVVR